METPQYMPTNAHVEFVGVFVMNVEGEKDLCKKLFYTGLVVVLTKLEICVSIVDTYDGESLFLKRLKTTSIVNLDGTIIWK